VWSEGLQVDGRYHLTEPLPDQGTGEVWKALDRRARDRLVVLVRLPADATIAASHDRMLEQARSLRHDAVLALIHHGRENGVHSLVREVFDAPSLATTLDRCRREGALLPRPVLQRIVEKLCDALEAAHGLSPPLVHGALTARCVLVQMAPKVVVRIADFALVGGDDVRRDLVALGAVLRLMFAAPEAPGRPPGRDGRRDDLPDALWEVAEGACAGRYPSDEALRDALEAAWRSPVTGAAARPVAASGAAPPATDAVGPDATDDPHAAPTEVTVRRQETIAQEAAAPPTAVVSDATQRSVRPSAPPSDASPREPTVTLDVGWAPGEATPKDATERKRVEPPASAHRAVVADTAAVMHVGLPPHRAPTQAPDDPTRVAVPLPTTSPAAVHEPPPSPNPLSATGVPSAQEGRHAWIVPALFVALFVGVAAFVALR